jgi:hypothetical protein
MGKTCGASKEKGLEHINIKSKRPATLAVAGLFDRRQMLPVDDRIYF